jgi:hypothetical protein
MASWGFMPLTLIRTAALLALLAGPPGSVEGGATARPLARTGLRYRILLKLKGEPMQEASFLLLPTPPTTSVNKVKKRRLGGWRLEAERERGTPYAQAPLLARAERLLFFSGPSPQTFQESYALRFQGRACPVWKVAVPAGVKAFAYLVEIAPKELVLCDLSARFDRGDVESVELHLEAVNLPGRPAPPENGTSLLTTLKRWADGEAEPVEPPASEEDGPAAAEVVGR